MRTKSLLRVACMCLFLLCMSSCRPDEEKKNNVKITFNWYGTEDLLKFTQPIVTWWNYPQQADGETIINTKWEKEVRYEDFDSIMVYAIVTYPQNEHFPDTTGKYFQVGQLLTAGITAEGEGSDHKITQIKALDGIDSYKIVRGGDMKNYLDSLSGVIDQIGFVVYRDGWARNKEKYEELNWKK